MDEIRACRTCGQMQRVAQLGPGEAAECCRCGSVLGGYGMAHSLQRAAAFSLAALVFYVPANIYPILRMNFYGAYSESTVWDGCVNLARDGQWLVATVVFFASILIPLVKLTGMCYLVTMAKIGSARRRRERTWIHRIIDMIGPWAMLDVFLLAVLVALVKLEKLATVLPGPGLLAFTAVVVFTILASASFDSRSIWEEPARVSS